MLAVELVRFHWGGGGVKLYFVGKSASVEPEHSVPLAAARHPVFKISVDQAVVFQLWALQLEVHH